MKQYIYTAVLLLGVFTASGKASDDLIKANYLYTHLAYHEAINYYKKVAPDLNDAVALSRLGDCYRLTKDPAQANVWYAKAITLNACPEETKLHYAQTLMNTGDYALALPLLRQYQTSNPNDVRTGNLIASCENINRMKSQMPVGNVQLLAISTDKSEFGPALRKNELFFTADTAAKRESKTDTWTGQPFYKIYSTSCNIKGDCGTLRELLGKTDTKYHDGPCSFSNDGNEMYFTRTSYKQQFLTKSPVPDKNDVVHLEIMMASDYSEGNNKYNKVTPFRYNNRNYSTAHPAINMDKSMLFFVSDMEGGQGSTDIYYCEMQVDGKWGKPKNAGATINTEGDELFPYVDMNNTLYFASNGHQGFGGLDIYKATFDKATGTFSAPVNMGMPLNSSYDDMSLVLNDDGSTGYFASDRPAEKKGDNIYSFNPQSLYLEVTALDSFTGKPVPDFSLSLKNAIDTGASNLMADARGRVLTRLFPNAAYTAMASAFNYYPKAVDISSVPGTNKSDTVKTTIWLRPNTNISMHMLVYDEQTRMPIDDPTVVFHKRGTPDADTVKLRSGEPFNKQLDPDNTYHVYALKENYYSNEKIISTKGIKPKAGGIGISDTLFMKQLKVGEVYKIDDIYYDYNKANVREDAKPALERLIALLMQYPNMKIQVNSHTDCRGADKYNLKLSDARAHSVISYLQQRSILLSRLKYKGYGETKPVYKCPDCNKCTEAEHQANRRTEFTIIAM